MFLVLLYSRLSPCTSAPSGARHTGPFTRLYQSTVYMFNSLRHGAVIEERRMYSGRVRKTWYQKG